jgi:hypothetical protein
MESVGITNQNTSLFLSSTVSNSLANQTPLHKHVASTPLDLSVTKNRFPSVFGIDPAEVTRRAQEAISGTPAIAFPNDLTSQAVAYVELNFKPYDRTSAFTRGALGGSKTILLPLPENYNQTFSMKYDQKDQGFLGDLTDSSPITNALTQVAEGSFGGTIDALRGLLENNEAEKVLAQLSKRAGYAMLDGFSDIAGGIAKQIGGAIPNPHSTIFFKGPDLRSFTWTWRLVPRSQNEGILIREILKRIRESILPKKSGNMLQYPDLMQPTIKIPRKDGGPQVDLGKFKRCLVRSMTVNYSAEGASAFFKDGHPVAIQMAMDFQEVEILTAEDQGN